MVHTKTFVQSPLTYTAYYSNAASASVPRILNCQELKVTSEIISLYTTFGFLISFQFPKINQNAFGNFSKSGTTVTTDMTPKS